MRARASDREWHDGRYEPVDWGARARAVLDSYVEQLYDAVRAHIEAELRASLAAKVRALADDYERKHAQSEVDEREFGSKAGAHGRWRARQEGAEAAAALIEGSDPASPITDPYAGHDGSDEPVSGMGMIKGSDPASPEAALDVERTHDPADWDDEPEAATTF